MSHGGLNILPKKSWNIWNRDNREKVQKDEQKHAAEQEKKRKRAEAVEQERRLEALRARAKRGRQDTSYEEAVRAQEPGPEAAADGQPEEEEVEEEVALVQADGHINLFGQLEDSTPATNPDAEAEQRRAKDAEERRLGIVSYLGQGSAELAPVKPWYHAAPGAPAARPPPPDDDDARRPGLGARPALTDEQRARRAELAKAQLDPLSTDMRRLAGGRRTHDAPAPAPRLATMPPPPPPLGAAPPAAAPARAEGSSAGAPLSPAEAKLAALRRERMAREAAERARAQRLVNGSPAPARAEAARDERSRPYNSAFHPAAAHRKRPGQA